MGKSGIAIERKMMKKRHRLTIFYLIFYAALLALISIGISLLLRGMAGTVDFKIPTYFYGSVLGIACIYNSIAVVLRLLFFFIFPGVLQFKGLTDNSWNMLYKFNNSPGILAINKLRICILSNLGMYLLGFIITAGAGYLFFGTTGLETIETGVLVETIVLIALVGILALLLVMSASLMIGALTRGSLWPRVAVLISSGFVFFSAYICGYLNYGHPENIVDSIHALISFNPMGLLLLPLILIAIFIPVTLSVASSRAKIYNTEELDDELLISLGISENILLLEEGHNRFHVAISGPRLHNTDYNIEIPELPQNNQQS